MTILFITNEYDYIGLNKTGGIGVFNKTIVENLSKRGNKVIVLGQNLNNLRVEQNNISIFFYKRKFHGIIGQILNRFIVLFKAVKLIFIYKIDIIETNDFIYGLMFKISFKRTPLVIRQHGMPSLLNKIYGIKRKPYTYLLEKIALISSNRIVAVSKYVKLLMEDVYKVDPKKISVIYNGMESIPYHINYKSKAIDILYVGTISEKKGYIKLVSFYNNLIEMGYKFNLTIVGKETNLKFNDLKFSEQSLKWITYLNHMNKEDLSKIYLNSKIMLNFSKGETFGLTIIEAMYYKIPVIMTKLGVSFELINNKIDGFVVEENMLHELPLLLEKLILDKEYNNYIGINANNKVRECFLVNKMVDSSLEEYNKLISNV